MLKYIPNNTLCFIGSGSIHSQNMVGIEIKQIVDLLAKRYNSLIYGGSTTGLMGQFANEFYSKNKNITSVYPQWLHDAGIVFDKDQTILCENLSNRKQIMFSNSKDLICYPGGFGTLDELFTFIEMGSVGEIDIGNIYLYNFLDYYSSILENLKQIASNSMLKEKILNTIIVFKDSNELKQLLNE